MVMPLNFDALENPELDVRGLCKELELDERKCRRLEGFVKYLQRGPRPRAGRPRTRWQECIAEVRKGKPFDPQAIKEAAKLYRAGKCPSK